LYSFLKQLCRTEHILHDCNLAAMLNHHGPRLVDAWKVATKLPRF
jgi:hypothetical protein